MLFSRNGCWIYEERDSVYKTLMTHFYLMVIISVFLESICNFYFLYLYDFGEKTLDIYICSFILTIKIISVEF